MIVAYIKLLNYCTETIHSLLVLSRSEFDALFTIADKANFPAVDFCDRDKCLFASCAFSGF